MYGQHKTEQMWENIKGYHPKVDYIYTNFISIHCGTRRSLTLGMNVVFFLVSGEGWSKGMWLVSETILRPYWQEKVQWRASSVSWSSNS